MEGVERRDVYVLFLAVVVLGVTTLHDHSPIDPVKYELPELPTLALPGVGQGTKSLSDAEKWFEGRAKGAEHIDFWCTEQPPHCDAYTGLADGSIVRFDPDKGPQGPLEFLNRTSSWVHGDTPDFVEKCGDEDHGHLCGRPLGLRVTPDGKQLIIADAYFGILCLNLATNALSLISNEYIDAEGRTRKINMANSIVISRQGRVFFTQTSPVFSLQNLMLEFMQARDNGLLLSLQHYNTPQPATIVADGLVFPNGLIMSVSQDFFLIASSQRAQIIKVQRHGVSENFSKTVLIDNLPCIPDNLFLVPAAGPPARGRRRQGGGGVLWVGCAAKRSRPFSTVDFLGSWPFLRRVVGSFLEKINKVKWLYAFSPSAGLALSVTLPREQQHQRQRQEEEQEEEFLGDERDVELARIADVFYDPTGQRVTHVSGAYVHKGRLYLTSFKEHVHYISALNLNCLEDSTLLSAAAARSAPMHAPPPSPADDDDEEY